MTGFQPEGCSHLSAAGCVSLRSRGDGPSGRGWWYRPAGDEFYNAAWRAAYSHFRRGRMTKTLPPSPSFRPKRSGVEKSPPLMVRAALRWEISRLRVSSKRFPSAPYRHASPLEMTVLASSIQSCKKKGGFALRHACGGHVHIEYHNHSYPRPHRLRWMASHWIRGSRGSPMNPVRLHTLRHFVALFP